MILRFSDDAIVFLSLLSMILMRKVMTRMTRIMTITITIIIFINYDMW